MSKSSWEKAVGIADSKFELPETDNTGLDEMRLKQRQYAQREWEKDLSKAHDKANKESHDQEDLDNTVTWAEMYKNVPASPEPDLELSVEEQILRELERTGHFYKAQGLLGSIKMLINEFNITKHQLASIKRAIGQ